MRLDEDFNRGRRTADPDSRSGLRGSKRQLGKSCPEDHADSGAVGKNACTQGDRRFGKGRDRQAGEGGEDDDLREAHEDREDGNQAREVDDQGRRKVGEIQEDDHRLATASSTVTVTRARRTATTTTIDFAGTSVGQKLSKNNALRTKLESRLKALGYAGTAYQAAYGFKNLGQFVAATNVSRNLGLSFEQLKIQMTGRSVSADGTVLHANMGTDGTVTMVDPADVTKAAPIKSLGQSIQTVKSTVDATAAAQTATTQADAEIQSTRRVSK